MGWVPDAPRTLILLKQLEVGERAVEAAIELFWAFCAKALSPEEFVERVKTLKSIYPYGDPNAGFMDPDIKSIMLRGFDDPESLVSAITERLDDVTRASRPAYQPDQQEDLAALHVYAHLQGARLARLRRVQGHSDDTRSALSEALRTIERFEASLQRRKPEVATDRAFEALRSFLRFVEFDVLRIDGEYERALYAFLDGEDELYNAAVEEEGYLVYNINDFGLLGGGQFDPSRPFQWRVPPAFNVQKPWGQENIECIAPWVVHFNFQNVVNCFEMVKSSGRVSDPKRLAEFCERLYDEDLGWFSDAQQSIDLEAPGFGVGWDWRRYWASASGWARARLEPSELLEVLQRQEDAEAERRLEQYFFRGGLWARIPEEVRRALVSADRDWFATGHGRREAALNELRIATAMLLHLKIWAPLNAKASGGTGPEIETFNNVRRRLGANGKRTPDLTQFAELLRSGAAVAVVENPSQEDLLFLKDKLPGWLKRLRDLRNQAEHDPRARLQRTEADDVYRAFLGIGTEGILIRLARILLA